MFRPKVHYAAIFQPAIPKTWQEYLYTTLYKEEVYTSILHQVLSSF